VPGGPHGSPAVLPRAPRADAQPQSEPESWSGSLMDLYIRAVAFLSRVAGVVAACLIGLSVIVVCDMVFERYVLNLTTIWQIDVVTYSIVAATFVGSAFVLMLRGHVNVEVLPLHLRPRRRYWLALVTTILALAFCLLLFILCTQYWYQAYSESWRSNTVWRARLWIPYLSMPVGLGLLVLQYVAELLSLVSGRSPPFGITRGSDSDDMIIDAGSAPGDAP
jgi:TRAP-type C4-dicarboxylate transport system permease small subunit